VKISYGAQLKVWFALSIFHKRKNKRIVKERSRPDVKGMKETIGVKQRPGEKKTVRMNIPRAYTAVK
jgi:hypothetical protein